MLNIFILLLRSTVWFVIALTVGVAADWLVLDRMVFGGMGEGLFSRMSFFTATLALLTSSILVVKNQPIRIQLALVGLAYSTILGITPLQSQLDLGSASLATLTAFGLLFVIALVQLMNVPGNTNSDVINSSRTNPLQMVWLGASFLIVQAISFYGMVVWVLGDFTYSDISAFSHLSPATALLVGTLCALYLDQFVFPPSQSHPKGVLRDLIVAGSVGWALAVLVGIVGLGYAGYSETMTDGHLFGLQAATIATIGSLFWLMLGQFAKGRESQQLQLDEQRIAELTAKEQMLLAREAELLEKNRLMVKHAKESEELYVISEQRIVELTQMNEQVRLMALENENMALAQRRFASVLAHEIRTPLNTLTGLINEMHEKGHSASCGASVCNEELESLKNTSEFMVDLVSSVLDYNKLKEGKLTVAQEPFNIKQVFENLSLFYSPRVAKKGLDLTFNVNKGSPVAIVGDRTRFRQILGNIIDNAIKFTDKGFVAVNYNFVHTNGQKTYAVLRIMDSGIGIKSDALETIFKPFNQASSKIGKQFGGSGVGLSLCKELVELMGGHIEVKSKENYGTTFTVYIPAKQCNTDQLVNECEELGKIDQPVNALMVEDHPINGKINKKLLEKMGVQVKWVKSGEEAVELADSQAFDVVLMDLDLGVGISGYEAAKKLQTSQLNSHAPIIALTASDAGTISEKLKDAGIKEVLDKPFKQEEAIALLRKVLAKKMPLSGLKVVPIRPLKAN